jgi:hypothetical protein
MYFLQLYLLQEITIFLVNYVFLDPRRSAAPLYGMKSDFVKGRQQFLEPFSRS